MKTIRANWEGIWQFLAERTDPKNACIRYPHYPGQINNGGQKFDSTATLAIPKWASAIDGLTTPKTQKWHSITLTDKYLADKFKVYLEQVRDILFARRYAARSNFTNANYEALKTIGHYGGAPFSITKDPLRPKGVIYKTWPIKEFYVSQNFQGDIDTYFRMYTATVRQLKQEFTELFLREFIALRYSIYIGVLKASDIGVSNYLNQIQDKTVDDSPYDKFQKKYRGFDFLSEYSVDYAKSWINIFKSCFGENIISVDIVNNVIRDEIWFEGHDKYWMSKVGDFFMFDEDADGLEALETFYKSVDNGKIQTANNLYYLYYKLVYFADIGALKENKVTFQKLILDYARKHAKKFKSYDMDPAEHYVSLFGEHGKNGQDDNKDFWLKLKAIFDPFQKKIDNQETNRAIDKFFQKFIPDSSNVYSLVTSHEWKDKDYTYFFSEFLAHDPKFGRHKHVVHAISDLNTIERKDAKIKDWCKKLLPFAESQWKKYLKAPKPLTNSQLSIFYLQKTLKEIAG